jgi:undecaprenyl-phosphate 4-deoxy-4-formamido-L-arabinose transferase
MFTLSIVIPVYNSENSIKYLVDLLIKSIYEYKLEIILVNDGSKDKSEMICIELHNTYPEEVLFFSLAKNVGEHNAVMAGLNNCSGDYVVIMDDDFQNPVSEVLKLVNEISSNDVDVVYTYYQKKEHHLFRNIGSKFNDRVANLMLGKPKDLYLSSFKAMNAFLVKEVIKYQLPFPYLDGLILRTTDKIGKIEVEHNKRENGQSGYTFTKLVSLWSNMFVNFSILPLRLSIILGFLSAIVGFTFSVLTIVEKINNPNLPVGYSLTIILISIFSGVLLISIGVLGEYLGRMFLSQTNKPQYTIRKEFSRKES